MCVCTSQASPAKGVAPSLISSTPPTLFLSSSFLSGRSAAAPHSIQQRRCRHHPAIRAAVRRGVSRGQVRCEPAPNEAQRAPPVIFLKDLSTGGRSGKRAGYGGAEGSLRREGIPRTREAGRPRAAAAAPLENPSSLFCANSSTLDRGSLPEELADASSPRREFHSFYSSPLSHRQRLKYFVVY